MTEVPRTDMRGKVIVCTGAASGIGRSTAEIAAQRGAAVVVADLNEAGGKETVNGIEAAGGAASFIRTDVTQEEDVRRMVEHTVETFGGLHGAFNNAGLPPTSKPLHKLELAEWQRSIEINLTGVFLCMKYEIEVMLEGGGGSIVNTSSAAGLRGNIGFTEYIAAKHGVIGITRAAAVEYGPEKIRVNTLVPGAVRTPMLQAGADLDLNVFSREKYPLARIGEPSELGEAVAWLLSDAASYVTGVYLPVDGGTTAT
ncbi:SDR family NAD(P)-dependent oxidoreductase [Rhodococcus opacus]|uniref:SDR family NAD(P)-dependent oxidoreductase n=1 Tax=Rhodococcus opacus TaxID=37919 RepID=UPI002474C448|nr:glucose 1-dehydrogenase [Rhodococcus opacus]MDH6291983.1 2,5-dichloro-2,5-cyclohexadiene-1,4-diol dehydrogenase 1 [Rhodococcus opacus]